MPTVSFPAFPALSAHSICIHALCIQSAFMLHSIDIYARCIESLSESEEFDEVLPLSVVSSSRHLVLFFFFFFFLTRSFTNTFSSLLHGVVSTPEYSARLFARKVSGA
jgi:hypothetical protein